VQGQVKAVDWQSAYGPFYTNNDTFTNNGTGTFATPVWQLSPAVNNPVIQPANQCVSLVVTVNVIPGGYYSLMGTCSEAGLCFTNTGEHFGWGEDTGVIVTAAVPLRTNMVDIVTASIDWYVRPTEGSNWCSAGVSGQHKIYITWATPTPVKGPVTLKRVDWACNKAKGSNSVDAVATAIHNKIQWFNLNNSCLNNAWLVLDAQGNPGYDCESLSQAMQYVLGVLGVSADLRYAYAATNSTPPPSCTSLETRTCPGGVHGYEELRYWAGDWNKWDGCCVVNSTWYPGGSQGSFPSALEVMRSILRAPGQYQVWVWFNPDWTACTNPGPFPVPSP